MKKNCKFVLISGTIVFFLICTTLLHAQLPAFPGAEGFGSTSVGGRNGVILEVTNLNADGPGSLREACNSTQRRIIVFRVSGTILLKKNIAITNPYITIAGQTAPGGGVTLRGAAISIRTHDVVIRGIRIRIGDDLNGPNPDNRDGLQISSNQSSVYNVIIDHCSVSWAVDENIQFWSTTERSTIQYCIISEGLRYSIHPKTLSRGQDHSNGILVGDGSNQISIHHNLFAHNLRRNPVINPGSSAEVINNVIYNWEIGTTVGASANVIANVYKPGLNTGTKKGIILPSWMNAQGPLYVKDNIGPGRMTNYGDDWLAVDGPISSRSFTPVVPLSNVSIDSVESVFDKVIKNAGAIIPMRDSVDERIVNDAINGTGQFIDSQNEVGGWPKIASGTPPPDSDYDGMPDAWEIAQNLNPQDPTDANNDRNGDGYTNIEEYINGLFDVSSSEPRPPRNVKLDK